MSMPVLGICRADYLTRGLTDSPVTYYGETRARFAAFLDII